MGKREWEFLTGAAKEINFPVIDMAELGIPLNDWKVKFKFISPIEGLMTPEMAAKGAVITQYDDGENLNSPIMPVTFKMAATMMWLKVCAELANRGFLFDQNFDTDLLVEPSVSTKTLEVVRIDAGPNGRSPEDISNFGVFEDWARDSQGKPGFDTQYASATNTLVDSWDVAKTLMSMWRGYSGWLSEDAFQLKDDFASHRVYDFNTLFRRLSHVLAGARWEQLLDDPWDDGCKLGRYAENGYSGTGRELLSFYKGLQIEDVPNWDGVLATQREKPALTQSPSPEQPSRVKKGFLIDYLEDR